ncbi:hypothetical protein HS088_TW20G00478 [Tripterygium wilfordii]|uniref:S-protein homolog n=1 Tax=Tripterygium wilfordii TaxID=458696 RepID=A0A7J7C7J0_TRIWF|nr:hypothetical protein HS088_TW20G00478 [Tripterygium wilfordii]
MSGSKSRVCYANYMLLLLFSFSLRNELGMAYQEKFLGLGEKVKVNVMNRLGKGQSLSLHCQSKDNDLGQQSVADGGEYGWDFTTNIIGNTLFYCDMGWKSTDQFHFDSYTSTRDHVRCKTDCTWLVAGEGIYGKNDQTGFWEFIYHW